MTTTTPTAIRHRIGIHAPQQRVHEAIASAEGVASWWSRETTGDGTQGGKLQVSFVGPDRTEMDGRSMTFDVVEVTPDRIEWRCIDGPPEWLVTDFVFELSHADGETVVLFTQGGWAEPVLFQAHCSAKWAVYLLSLKSLLERGEGRPFPNDVHVSSWD